MDSFHHRLLLQFELTRRYHLWRRRTNTVKSVVVSCSGRRVYYQEVYDVSIVFGFLMIGQWMTQTTISLQLLLMKKQQLHDNNWKVDEIMSWMKLMIIPTWDEQMMMMMMKMRQRCRSLFCSNYTLYRAAFGCGVPTTTTPSKGRRMHQQQQKTNAPTFEYDI